MQNNTSCHSRPGPFGWETADLPGRPTFLPAGRRVGPLSPVNRSLSVALKLKQHSKEQLILKRPALGRGIAFNGHE
jgi:hypothetical protein